MAELYYQGHGSFRLTAEAGRCADLVGARQSIPLHTKPGVLFDRKQAEQFRTAGRIILEAGESLSLE